MPQPRLVRITAVLIQAFGKASADTTDVLQLEAWVTADGHLDQTNQRQDQPAQWFRRGQPFWSGWLRWVDQDWALCSGAGEDARLWRLDWHRLRPGEHLTLRDQAGEALVFRIVNVAANEP
jgi:hypothetical protein